MAESNPYEIYLVWQFKDNRRLNCTLFQNEKIFHIDICDNYGPGTMFNGVEIRINDQQVHSFQEKYGHNFEEHPY